MATKDVDKTKRLSRWLIHAAFYLATRGVVALAVATLVTLLVLNLGGFKRPIETAVSDAIDMELRLHGWLGIGFYPTLYIALNGVSVRNQDTELLTVETIEIGLDPRPLVRGEVRIGHIKFDRPNLIVVQHADGSYNFETAAAVKPPAKPAHLPAFAVPRLTMANARVVYDNKASGAKIEAAGCALAIDHVQFPGGSAKNFISRLSFTSELGCQEIRADRLAAGIALKANAKNGIVDLDPIDLRLFGGRGTGNARLDYSGTAPHIAINYTLSNMQLEHALKAMWPGKSGRGTLDADVQLSMAGELGKTMKSRLQGNVSLRGVHLVLDGTDLDQQIARFKESQNFSLIDVGALYFIGPLGLIASKGYDFAVVFTNTGGSTDVGKLVSDWRIDNGVAHSQDVALSTRKHRIAVNGRLNFVSERFDSVSVAIIDARGCAIVRHGITGPFDKPTVDKPGVLKTLFAPIAGLFTTNARCKPLYTGSVAAPE